MSALFSAAGAEEWISIGPFGTALINNDVISGQVNALAVDPRDANILYVGASEGGVWKTRDGGATWTALTDTQLVRKLPTGKNRGTLSIGALAIDPGNSQTIYAGTGDPNVACCFAGPGLGVFRSTDSGNTWVPMGVNLNQAGCENGAIEQTTVNRILVVPGRPAVVYAATNAGLFNYRENATDCWKRLTYGMPMSGRAIDLVADPYRGALYVAFHSQGIFKSNDLSGAQWQPLTGGLPATGFGRIAFAFGGRVGVGFSQPLPLLYAGFNDVVANKYRLFNTVNGGDQWSELPSPPSDGQLDFNYAIAVGSYDSDEVYVGQVGFWRALDGGRKGGGNKFNINPPITDNSWTVLGCCLSDSNPSRRGLDLHGDIHDIVFAPYGSFLPSPAQVQIVYVASDGGVTKGNIDFEGVVSWEPLTKGLAIGQAGTIGLDPGSDSVTVAGLWHNGDILTLSPLPDSFAIAGGDGFQTTIDAGSLTVYVNCNAGFGGSICRVTPPGPFNTSFGIETIWSQSPQRHWSDPHRPGHLLRLQAGLLFRTTVANTAAANVLNTADAWEAVDPFFGKTGQTTTMAFRSRVLEEQSVYYIGTATGQIWRGSSEAGWTKLCECGLPVNAIAPDLFRNEHIFAVLNSSSSPGRIKELTRLPNGTWTAKNIDSAFMPDLDVLAITSVVVDPGVPETQGTTVFVGTDQGVYRGHVDSIVLDPGVSAMVLRPPVFGDWTWRRSPGVPNVFVTDMEVHQNFQAHDRSGIVRVGTYGRGLFELKRISSTGPIERPPLTLSVQAVQVGEDGAPPPLRVTIPVAMKDRKFTGDTPFELLPPKGTEVSLEAPQEIRTEDAVLRFVGWAIPGRRSENQRKISLKVDEATRAIAYYEEEKSIPDPKAKPLRVAVSTSAREVCVQSFTHELMLSWEISDGQRPVTVRAEITHPDQHVEHIELKPIEGSQSFPMTFPNGGSVRAKVIATDSSKASSSAESNVELKPCRPGSPQPSSAKGR